MSDGVRPRRPDAIGRWRVRVITASKLRSRYWLKTCDDATARAVPINVYKSRSIGMSGDASRMLTQQVNKTNWCLGLVTSMKSRKVARVVVRSRVATDPSASIWFNVSSSTLYIVPYSLHMRHVRKESLLD